MNQANGIRRIIDSFTLAGSEIALFQREDDPFDTLRLAEDSDLDAELGRVVNLSGSRPQLATSRAVWAPDIRNDVLKTVRKSWRAFELEVIG